MHKLKKKNSNKNSFQAFESLMKINDESIANDINSPSSLSIFHNPILNLVTRTQNPSPKQLINFSPKRHNRSLKNSNIL